MCPCRKWRFKFNSFGCRAPPEHARGAYSALSDPLAGFGGEGRDGMEAEVGMWRVGEGWGREGRVGRWRDWEGRDRQGPPTFWLLPPSMGTSPELGGYNVPPPCPHSSNATGRVQFRRGTALPGRGVLFTAKVEITTLFDFLSV